MKQRLRVLLVPSLLCWLALPACGGGGSDRSPETASPTTGERGTPQATETGSSDAAPNQADRDRRSTPSRERAASAQSAFPTVLTAPRQVTVRARVEGQVVRVRREEGARVRADEVLVVLDARPYQFALDRAAAEAKLMLLTYNSKARLRGEAISENEVEIAEAEYRKAQADSALRQLDLDNTSIRAPISGYVSERRVRDGQWVARQEHVYTIVDPAELWAVALVPTELAAAMELGNPVEVSVGRGEQQQVAVGSLHLRSPVADPGSGRIRITVRIDNPDRRLTPGMPASLIIPAG